jgi:predicted RNA-binding Zn ribbon-like protein
VNSELVIDFVNSLELDPHVEALDSPRALVAWLAERGLVAPGTRATQANLAEAVAVREALRDLIGAQNDLPADVDASTSVIDAAARRARLGVRFAGGATRVEPASPGVRGALGRILAEVSAGMADGTWSRVKACRAGGCRWAFLDTAKNQSRAWCSMETCGNREKARAYRERHQLH